MYKVLLLTLSGLAVIAAPVGAQTFVHRANVIGGASPAIGTCKVSVVVDGSAQIQLTGGTATVSDVSGAAPQFQVFDCTGPLPTAPADFQFQGVSGMGNMRLVRGPGYGTPAVIQIENPQGGSSVYTFQISWTNPGFNSSAAVTKGREYREVIPSRRALDSCEGAVRHRARGDFSSGIDIQSTHLERDPGDRDYVSGTFTLDRDQDHLYQFSCTASDRTGHVASLQISPLTPGTAAVAGEASRVASETDFDLQNCANAAQNRLLRRGYTDVRIGQLSVQEAAGGRNEWVSGTAQAATAHGRSAFNFNCNVNPSTGNVQTLNISPQ